MCWIHLSATQKRIKTDRVYVIITCQFALQECVEKIVSKSGDENCSQDNLCLEKTRSNTVKYWGSWALRRLVLFLGIRDQNCRCKTLTQFYQRVAIDRTKNYKEKQYKQIKTHMRTEFWVRRSRRKVMKQAVTSCTRQKLSNSLQTSTCDSKEYNGKVHKEYTLWHNWKWSFEMNQNSDSKFHTKTSSRIKKRACLGKPRSIDSYIWWLVGSKQVVQVLWERSRRT